MDLPGAPRSTREVTFFVDESPCESCGVLGFRDRWPAYDLGRYVATCAGCGVRREFHFTPLPGESWLAGFRLGPDDEVSRVFTDVQLRAIADRELTRVPPEPTELPTMTLFREARHRLERARTALVELQKFRPEDASIAAELERVVELHGEYMRAEDVVDSKLGAHPKSAGIENRLLAHRRWLERGRAGDGQLVIKGESHSQVRLSVPLLTAALIDDSTFDKVDFANGTFAETVLRRVRFLDCGLSMSRFERMSFEQCDLTGSRLSLSDLVDVFAAGGDWREIVGGRSTWRGHFQDLDLRDARLRDSVFDDSTFQRCDFRKVDISRKDVHLTALGTARRARFVDCDLRGMRIEGWRLDGTAFERCRMEGFEGAPVIERDVHIEGCDFAGWS